jgi:hypothetical protein
MGQGLWTSGNQRGTLAAGTRQYVGREAAQQCCVVLDTART